MAKSGKTNSEETPHIDSVIAEIQNLKEAKEILDKVWFELGPYDQRLGEEISDRLRSFYGYDDSE